MKTWINWIKWIKKFKKYNKTYLKPSNSILKTAIQKLSKLSKKIIQIIQIIHYPKNFLCEVLIFQYSYIGENAIFCQKMPLCISALDNFLQIRGFKPVLELSKGGYYV